MGVVSKSCQDSHNKRAPRRNPGDGAAALVGPDQRVEDVLLRGEVGLRRDEVRVHRGHVRGERDPQLRGG